MWYVCVIIVLKVITGNLQITKIEGKLGPVNYIHHFAVFNDAGTQMVIVESQLQSNGDYFGHLTLYSTEKEAKDQTPIIITQGLHVVLEIHNWDDKTNRIFYMANLPDSLESQHLFTVKAQAGAKPQCLTCTLDGGDKGISMDYLIYTFRF